LREGMLALEDSNSCAEPLSPQRGEEKVLFENYLKRTRKTLEFKIYHIKK
jgi:hypothetical protein